MAKIRKIYDQTIKPDGSKTTIYPITSTRAVYTTEGETLDSYLKDGYFHGADLRGYKTVSNVTDLPTTENQFGWLIGEDLYVWVGTGGDTLGGLYQNCGHFRTPYVPDDEDLAADSNNELKLKDRTIEDGGMGYVILRKNKSFVEQVTKANTIYEIRYDFDLRETVAGLVLNVAFSYGGGTFYRNGTAISLVAGQAIWVPNGCDVMDSALSQVLSVAGAYTPASDTTVYVVSATAKSINYRINGTITVPANCVLHFVGGVLRYGIITGQSTFIDASSIQILDSCILSGVFCNESVRASWFGIKAGEDYMSLNDGIFSTYLISSIENIKLTFILDVSVHFGQPIEFSGQYNVRLEGEMIYHGDANSRAVSIGKRDEKTTRREIFVNYIKSAESKHVSGESVPNHIGLILYNLDGCNVTIIQIAHFAYNLVFYAHNYGFQNNIFHISMLTGWYAVGLYMYADGSGWMNENLIVGCRIAPWSGNPYKDDENCTGIFLNNNASYTANSNQFIKPNLEGNIIAIKLKNANRNVFFMSRHESNETILEASDDSYDNSVIPSLVFETVEAPIDDKNSKGRNNIVSKIASLASRGLNLPEEQLRVMTDVNSNRCIKGKEIVSTSGNLAVAGASLIAGDFYDIVDDDNYISIRTDINRRHYVFLYDNNWELITPSQAVGYYITSPFWGIDSTIPTQIKSAATLDSIGVSFDRSHVSHVFVGVNVASTELSFTHKVMSYGVSRRARLERVSGNRVRVMNKIAPSDFSALFYGNYLENYIVELYEDIDLTGLSSKSLKAGMTIELHGGKFKNGTLNINRARILPDYSDLIDATMTISGNPAAGTTHFNGTKPLWYNGTNWVDASGEVV